MPNLAFPSRARPFARTATSLALAGALILAWADSQAAGAVWSATTTLASDSQTQGILNPAIAANTVGQKLAVWVQGGQVQARFYANGAWGAPVVLSQATLGVASPTVALADDGKAVVGWIQTQGSGTSSLEAAFLANGSWSLPVMVSNASITVASPKVGLSGSGQATLAWSEVDGTGTQCAIQAATGSVAGGWSQPQTLANACHSFVSLSVNAAGEAVAGWGDINYLTGAGVYVATRDTAGTWTGVTELAPPQYRQYLPSFSMGEDGTAVAVWVNTYTGLMYSRKRPGANWSAAGTAYAGMSNIASLSDVTVDGQGNATAVFLTWTMLPTGAIAYPLQSAQLKKAANTWSKPIYVTAKNQNIYNFSVESSSAGSLGVAWSDGGTGKTGVATMLPGETRWTNATLGKGGYEVSLDMAAGNAALLWNNTYAPVSLNASTAVTP